MWKFTTDACILVSSYVISGKSCSSSFCISLASLILVMFLLSWNKELKTQFCISLASLILVMPVFSWNKEFKTQFCTLFPPGLKTFYFIPFWSFYPLFTSSYEQIKGSNKHENNKQLENMFFKNKEKKICWVFLVPISIGGNFNFPEQNLAARENHPGTEGGN